MERINSGKGGFSVKGAAAAAAKARWDKARREKTERGEDSDDGVRRMKMPGKKDSRVAMETFESESTAMTQF